MRAGDDIMQGHLDVREITRDQYVAPCFFMLCAFSTRSVQYSATLAQAGIYTGGDDYPLVL